MQGKGLHRVAARARLGWTEQMRAHQSLDVDMMRLSGTPTARHLGSSQNQRTRYDRRRDTEEGDHVQRYTWSGQTRLNSIHVPASGCTSMDLESFGADTWHLA